MTAFITRYSKNCLRLDVLVESLRKRAAQLCTYWVIVCAGLLSTPAIADTPVELHGLKFERQDSGLFMSTDLQFDLPTALDDALLKGITLYFVTEVEMTQERWYVYNQRVARAERHIRLFYQPLTRRWRVNISPQPFTTGLGVSLGQSYDTAEEAMGAVKHIVQWRIANASDYNSEYKQTVSISFRLDLKQLPKPLQIGAVGQSDWNVGVTKTLRLELNP